MSNDLRDAAAIIQFFEYVERKYSGKILLESYEIARDSIVVDTGRMGEFFEEELVAPDAVADSLFARAKKAYTNQKEESCDAICTYRDFIRLEREISSLREEVRSLISLKEPVEAAEEEETVEAAEEEEAE